MEGLNFKEEYWHDALGVLEQEEAWNDALEVLEQEEAWLDALVVLKRQEKILFAKKWSPIFAAMLIGFGLFFGIQDSDSPGLQMKSYSSDHIALNKSTSSSSLLQPDSKLGEEKEGRSSVSVQSAANSMINFDENEVKDFAELNTQQIVLQNNINSENSFVKNDLALDANSKQNAPNDQNASEESKADDASRSLIAEGLEKQTITEYIFENGIRTDSKEPMKTDKLDNPINLTAHNETKEERIAIHDLNTNTSIPARIGMMNFSPTILPTRFSVKANLYREYRSVERIFSAKRNELRLVLGTSQLTKYGTAGERFLNPELGLEYERMLNPKLAIKTTASYFSISGTSHSHSISDHNFGFGSQETKTHFLSEKIHFASLSSGLSWKVKPNHSFYAGLGASFIVNNVTTITTENFRNENLVNDSSNQVGGYFDGYNRINASSHIGYEYEINSKLSLDLSYQYGLNKITKEEIYGQFESDRNSRLRASFRILLK